VIFESWSRFVARLRALQGAGLATGRRRRRRTSLVLLALASVAGLALLALVIYSAVELARFDRVEARRAALIYTMPQALAVGVHIKIAISRARSRACPTPRLAASRRRRDSFTARAERGTSIYADSPG